MNVSIVPVEVLLERVVCEKCGNAMPCQVGAGDIVGRDMSGIIRNNVYECAYCKTHVKSAEFFPRVILSLNGKTISILPIDNLDNV